MNQMNPRRPLWEQYAKFFLLSFFPAVHSYSVTATLSDFNFVDLALVCLYGIFIS